MGQRRISIEITDDATALAHRAVEVFADAANEAVERRGSFLVSLAGGTTPRRLYSLLAEDPHRSRVPWHATVAVIGDERPVPPDHEDSNYGMIRGALLDHVSVRSVCRFRAERIDPVFVVDDYELRLRELSRSQPPNVPRLDLVLLGLGTDAHTASLFPHTEALREDYRLAAAPWVEDLGGYRFTQTPVVINGARRVVFLVSGESKSSALKNVLEGPYDPMAFPAQIVAPEDGEVLWLVDRDAAARLDGAGR